MIGENIKKHVLQFDVWMGSKVSFKTLPTIYWKISYLMFKFSVLDLSLVQWLEIVVFGLHLNSIPKVLTLSTKMPQKISQQIFFCPSWQNLDTLMSTACLRTAGYIFMISIH